MLFLKNTTTQVLLKSHSSVNTLFDLATDVIVISKQLLLLAEESNWDEFAELDAKRQSLVRSINVESLELSNEENVTFHQLLNEMISLNEQLEKVCTEQRRSITEKLKEIGQGAKAAKAYR